MGIHRFGPLVVVLLACAVGVSTPALVVAGTGQLPASAALSAPRGGGTHRDALLVRFAADTSNAAAEAAISAAGATQIGRIDQLDTRVVVAAAGRSRAQVRLGLLTAPSVVSVEADVIGHTTLTPDDTYWSNEWYARKVRSDRAWNITTGSDGPAIAVLDTGVQATQPDLAGRVLAGYDFVNNDDNPADDMGHGTKVSGVVNGVGMNSLGVAGTCWGCRILPVKVADRYGNVSFANAAAGLIWATDHGARIVNMSFGHTSGTSTMAAAVDYAHNHGVVVVAAAGNEGNKAKFYPAAYAGVLSVAATDQNDNLYSWSTRGDWVRLAAPGCTWTTRKGTNWGSFCGTSASAPIVAGIAGLILAYKPDASQSAIEDAIASTAVSISANIGGGRVDSYSAVHKFEPKPGGGHH